MAVRLLFAGVFALVLTACADPVPISTSPLQSVVASSPVVQQGLADAAYNFDNAIKIGILKADDPAASCVHAVLDAQAATEAAAQSFTPKTSDLISAASVAYILAQQVQAARAAGVSIPVGCEAVVGKVVIDGVRAGVRVGGSILPGAGALGVLK